MKIKKSSSVKNLVFYMVDSADHVTPKTGLAPTVTISKNGAAFGAVSGAVSEISGGFYMVAANSDDSDTLGMLALKAFSVGADPVAMAYEVVGYDPDNADSLGLSRIDATIGSRSSADSVAAVPLAVWGEVLPDDYADGSAGSAVGRLNLTPADAPVIITPDPSDDEDLCSVYINAEGISNVRAEGMVVGFQLVAELAKSERVLTIGNPVEMTTDATGYAAISLQRTDKITPDGCYYEVTCVEIGMLKTRMELTSELFNIADLIE